MGHLGTCPKQKHSAKLCSLTGTASSKTQMCGFRFLDTIKRNKSGCFSLGTGGGMILALMEVLFFTYISAEMMSRQNIKLASLY